MKQNPEIIEWLLEEKDPSVRYRTLTELLDYPADDPLVITAKAAVASSKPVTNLLSRMHPDGYWLDKTRKNTMLGDGVLYTDYNTTHFCLAYLAEMGMDKENPQVYQAADRYLGLQQPDGDFYQHFSCLYGYNIRTLIKLGFRDDPRLQKTIDLMLTTERHDGGYLCDMHEGKYKNKPVKSCVRGCVKALLAFAELPEYREHPRCKELVGYFLNRNCIFQTGDPPQPVNGDVTATIFPIIWRAGLVEILYALSAMGYGARPEVKQAWELLETKKDEDGRYRLDWTPSQVQKLFKVGKRNEPNKWITLYAMLAGK